MILRTTDLKRGATFSLAGYVNLPPGTWAIDSTVRDPAGTLVEQLTANLIAPIAPETQYSVSLSASPAQTAVWPVGTLNCDVRYTDSDLVLITPTFNIIVEESETHG